MLIGGSGQDRNRQLRICRRRLFNSLFGEALLGLRAKFDDVFFTLNFNFVAKEKAKGIPWDVAQDVGKPSSGVSTSPHNFLREFGLFVADWNEIVLSVLAGPSRGLRCRLRRSPHL